MTKGRQAECKRRKREWREQEKNDKKEGKIKNKLCLPSKTEQKDKGCRGDGRNPLSKCVHDHDLCIALKGEGGGAQTPRKNIDCTTSKGIGGFIILYRMPTFVCVCANVMHSVVHVFRKKVTKWPMQRSLTHWHLISCIHLHHIHTRDRSTIHNMNEISINERSILFPGNEGVVVGWLVRQQVHSTTDIWSDGCYATRARWPWVLQRFVFCILYFVKRPTGFQTHRSLGHKEMIPWVRLSLCCFTGLYLEYILSSSFERLHTIPHAYPIHSHNPIHKKKNSKIGHKVTSMGCQERQKKAKPSVLRRCIWNRRYGLCDVYTIWPCKASKKERQGSRCGRWTTRQVSMNINQTFFSFPSRFHFSFCGIGCESCFGHVAKLDPQFFFTLVSRTCNVLLYFVFVRLFQSLFSFPFFFCFFRLFQAAFALQLIRRPWWSTPLTSTKGLSR